jgi:hypothetical protein
MREFGLPLPPAVRQFYHFFLLLSIVKMHKKEARILSILASKKVKYHFLTVCFFFRFKGTTVFAWAEVTVFIKSEKAVDDFPQAVITYFYLHFFPPV